MIPIRFSSLLIPGIAACLLCLAAACGGNASGNAANASTADSAAAETFCPPVPDSLTTPDQRADWAVVHYWDNFDFRSDPRAADTAFVEQTMADYISLMPYASATCRAQGVDALLDSAAVSAPALDLIHFLARKYLYEAASPMHDEMFYLPFVEHALRRSSEPDPALEGLRDDILKNSPGTMAPAFTAVAPDGSRFAVPDTSTGGGTLLIFYEPDCEDCHRAIRFLAASEMLNRAVADGAITVMAVFAGDDSAEWREHAATMPAGWRVGRDTGAVDSDELYLIRATPTFYLIDPDGRVVLKDPTLQNLAMALGL